MLQRSRPNCSEVSGVGARLVAAAASTIKLVADLVMQAL